MRENYFKQSLPWFSGTFKVVQNNKNYFTQFQKKENYDDVTTKEESNLMCLGIDYTKSHDRYKYNTMVEFDSISLKKVQNIHYWIIYCSLCIFVQMYSYTGVTTYDEFME